MRVVEDSQGVASATRLPTVVGGAAEGKGEASAARLPTKEGGDDEGEASAARAEGLPCNIPPLPNPSAPSSLVPLNMACEDPIVLERVPPRRKNVHDVAPSCDVLPASQSLQTEAPVAEYLPATQLVQMVTVTVGPAAAVFLTNTFAPLWSWSTFAC